MASSQKGIRDIYRNEGLMKLIQRGIFRVYERLFLSQYDRYVAPRLPPQKAVYNGVTTKAARRYDGFIPGRPVDRSQYESALVAGIHREVSEGDSVVIVGGGWGVTATQAARIVGPEGSVTVFEGSHQEVSNIRETLRLNEVDDIVDVNHCIVGEAIDLRGEARDANQLMPADLPECDVLELDCEGAEIEILQNLEVQPRSILVETHGMHNATPDRVQNILEENSYSVIEEELADEDIARYCFLNEIYVLTARLE